MSKKSLLTFNFYYPPRQGSDIRRPLEMYPRLASRGWDVQTITTGAGEAQKKDDRSDQDGVKVIRIREPGEPYFIKALQAAEILMGFPSIISVRSTSWFRRVFEKACQIIRRENVDVLYTPGPPFVQLLIGLKLKKRFGIRWIADFQDSWVDNPVIRNYWSDQVGGMYFRMTNVIMRKLESLIISSADCVIFFQRSHPRRYAKKYQVNQNQLFWLPNGISDDLMFPTSRSKMSLDWNQELDAGFAGSFYQGFPSLFHSVKRWVRDVLPNVRFTLVGSCSRSYRNQYGDDRAIDFYSYKPFERMIEILRRCDVLFYLSYRKDHFPQTLPESVAMGKPVWGFAPRYGDSEYVIKKLGSGLVLGIEEEPVKRRLKMFVEWMNKGNFPARNNANLAKFRWDHLSRRFGQILAGNKHERV